MADGYMAGSMGLSLYEGYLRNGTTKLSPANINDIVSKCERLEPAIRSECKMTAAALRQTTVELLAGTTTARVKLLLERFRTSFFAELVGQRMLILSDAEEAALYSATTPAAFRATAQVAEGRKANSGGRPSGKAGEPIARLTIRLMNSSSEDLANQTASALARDLIAEYKRLNLLPPALSNAEREAAGILRALRG